MCSSIRFSIASNRIRYMGYILYITFAPSLCLWALGTAAMVANSAQSQTITCWSSMECSESCCRNWTSAHVAYFSAFACARWIVKANNNTATTTKGERVKGWRRNCSKGPGRIFVYLLHILGFTATTTSSRFCGRYLLCLPSLPQQWHSREPQQHNSGNNKGHSYHTSGHQLLQVRPFDFTQLIYLLPENLQESLSLSLSLCPSLSLSISPCASTCLHKALCSGSSPCPDGLACALPAPWLQLASFVAIYWLVFPVCDIWNVITMLDLNAATNYWIVLSVWVRIVLIHSPFMPNHMKGNMLFKNIHNNSSATR